MKSGPFGFYSDASDEILVKEAKCGGSAAQNVLLQRYRGAVKSIAARYSAASLETDDIMQEGFLGLLSAIDSFSEDRQVSFRTYAGVCISNSIKSALKTDARLKNFPLNSYIPIENIDAAASGTPEEFLIAQENTERIKKLIASVLSPLEKNVLFSHLSGKTYGNIAKELFITEKAVNNALQRARFKLRRLLRENNS